ncbi:MAG: hypothetical protein J0M12_13730 [Deltaproteobacteria bacterium]|nr:hypothetical protein [Deltaproteobacteria bacterium]
MSKTPKTTQSPTLESDAFEMIELAMGDLDTLTRAFTLISEVCEEGSKAPRLAIDTPPKNLVN